LIVSLIISIPVSCCIALILGSTFALPYRFTSCLVAFIALASAIPAGALIGFLWFIGETNDFTIWGMVLFSALPVIGIGSIASKKRLRQVYEQQQLAAAGYP
jgi:ABC-type proline/glycine betaine transport system permease subunit